MERSELLNACTIWMHRKDKLERLLISKTYPESKKLKAAKLAGELVARACITADVYNSTRSSSIMPNLDIRINFGDDETHIIVESKFNLWAKPIDNSPPAKS